MPISDGAAGTRGGEVGDEPGVLNAARIAAENIAVGVEHDDVPCTKFVRVPPLSSDAGSVAEVSEVGFAVIGADVMVANRRPGPLEQPPQAGP